MTRRYLLLIAILFFVAACDDGPTARLGLQSVFL